jgi:hypothetical protein
MWDPQHLTTLKASMACYSDNSLFVFCFFLLLYRFYLQIHVLPFALLNCFHTRVGLYQAGYSTCGTFSLPLASLSYPEDGDGKLLGNVGLLPGRSNNLQISNSPCETNVKIRLWQRPEAMLYDYLVAKSNSLHVSSSCVLYSHCFI